MQQLYCYFSHGWRIFQVLFGSQPNSFASNYPGCIVRWKKRAYMYSVRFLHKAMQNRLRMVPLLHAGGQLLALRANGLAPEAGVQLWWAQGKARASAVEAGSKVFEGARTWSVQGSVAPWSSRAFEVTQSALQECLWLEGRWGLTIWFGAPPLGSCYASLLHWPAAAEVQKCSDPVFNFLKYFLLFLFHTVYYNIETLNLPPAKERSPSYKHRILLFSFFHL